MSTPNPDEAMGMANDPYIDEQEHAHEQGGESAKTKAEGAETTADTTGGEDTGSATGR